MAAEALLFQLMAALAAALCGAALASLLRQSVVVGYLLAGIAIGPFTPGFIGDPPTLQALADIGIVFLMFTIGVQLSFRELVRDGYWTVPAALIQVGVLMLAGWGVGRAIGLGGTEALFLGAVVSNSSSTVLAKILGDRSEAGTAFARIGLAWSSVQDVSATVLVALVPILAIGPESAEGGSLWPLVGAAVFLVVVGPLSFLVLPRVLQQVERLRSRELFVLAVAVVALAMAHIASLLGVSVALGAFLAGIVAGESDLSHRVLGDAAPLRDLFSGLFFVAVGMLVDPGFVLDHLGLVAVAVLLIVPLKGIASALIARSAGASRRVAVHVGAGLAQSGEFSFLLAHLGLSEQIVSLQAFNLMLSAAVASILLSPAVHAAIPAIVRALGPAPALPGDDWGPRAGDSEAPREVICGFGRVGAVVASLLQRSGVPYLVIEEDRLRALEARVRGFAVLVGDASNPHVLERAGLAGARVLIVCLPERMSVRRVVDYARRLHPDVEIVARAHSERERIDLLRAGVDEPVLGELELALEMGRHALLSAGVGPAAIEASIEALRGRAQEEA